MKNQVWNVAAFVCRAHTQAVDGARGAMATKTRSVAPRWGAVLTVALNYNTA